MIWIKSYDWLLSHLYDHFCEDKLDREAFIKWIQCTSPQHVCITIYTLFGNQYISDELAKTFNLTK